MSNSVYQVVLEQISFLLEPIVAAAESELSRRQLFESLGWDLEAIAGLSLEELTDRLASLAEGYENLKELVENPPDEFTEFLDVLDLVQQMFEDIRQLYQLVDQPPPQFNELGRDLIALLTTTYLRTYQPLLYQIAVLGNVIEPPEYKPLANAVVDELGAIVRLPHRRPELQRKEITNLLTDPVGQLKKLYLDPSGRFPSKEQAKAAADKLFPKLGLLFDALGVKFVYGIKPNLYGFNFGEAGNELGAAMITFEVMPDPEGKFFGATLAFSAADQGDLGLVVVPFGDFNVFRTIGEWTLALELTPGVEAFAIGPNGSTVIAGQNTSTVKGQLTVTKLAADDGLAFLVGDVAGTRLEVGQFQLTGDVSLDLAAGKHSYGLTCKTASTALVFDGVLVIAWKQFNVYLGNDKTVYDCSHLKISSPLLPSITLEGDLHLVFKAGKLTQDSYFKRYESDTNNQLPLQNFHIDNKCLVLRWNESHINYWLRQLTPNFFDESSRIDQEATIRVLFGKPVQEIRLDWQVSGSRTFALPGLKVTTPNQGAQFTLLLSSDGGKDLTHVAIALTLQQGAALTASSNFAWKDDQDPHQTDRELQVDEKKAEEPLFKLTLTPQENVSIVLLDFKLNDPKLPKFFRQLENLLEELDFANTPALQTPVNYALTNLKSSSWKAAFDFNFNEFAFPFLKQDGEGDGLFSQTIKIGTPKAIEPNKKIEPDFKTHTLSFLVPVTVNIGSLSLDTEFGISFDWETFALKVDHSKGIDFVSPQEQIPADAQEFLGLRWRFKGRKITEEGLNKGKYHFFTLATKDYNYQLQQAPESVFEVDFTQASDEPITFAVSDFVLSAKGVSLSAAVTDKPVRLNGLDTRFRFHGSRFEIKENRIKDFTLSGSGPLPPALVGDATADISLQFSQRNGNLTLVAGSAKLKGSKLLDCRATRFQFSVDAIALKFVYDGKFHLYFTITGSAQFSLAPSDDRNGPLALLSLIKIDLVECPLTGDARVIGKHVKFLIELPKRKSFNFLGCFEMELRAIGFLPQADVFGGDGAMQLTGQLKFAQGAGDTPDSRAEYHTLFIGLPKKGEFVPRIYFKKLPVNLNMGAAFKLNGVVEFEDSLQEKGFKGEGVLEIQGLPTMAASFAFLRVRQNESSPWVRAWFIYLEVRQISFKIPVVEFYLREVGLGFGYRYTLASIKEADRANDVRSLIKGLKELSRTQGDLSKRDRWQVDLEERGEDPRWTIVLRALISQLSASPSPLKWDEAKEQNLPCVYLFDAVVALRSDLTFFMAVRAWLNTNYYNYVKNTEGLREKPLFSGFVLLSPRQKRFLAHLASNPKGHLGSSPPLPKFLKSAIQNGQFSATLLVEPGLVHYELGWPNMLRWSEKYDALEVELRGGFILRIAKGELVVGSSFLARAKLRLAAEFDFGIVGGRISAEASVAYGARYIGVLDAKDVGKSAFYGAIGLEAQIRFSIEFWIRIKLIFKTIQKSFRLSMTISFTAGLEVGLNGVSPGMRGSGTVSLSVMGHSLHLNVKLGFAEKNVTKALERTKKYLKMGLEATEVEAVPGLSPSGRLKASRGVRAAGLNVSGLTADTSILESSTETFEFHAPNYNIFVVRNSDDQRWSYFVLLPQGDQENAETGFLPAPPDGDRTVENDFILRIPATGGNFELEQFIPSTGWSTRTSDDWKVNWDAEVETGVNSYNENGQVVAGEDNSLKLRQYLRHAFRSDDEGNLLGDPNPLPTDQVLEDERVHNPSDNSFEAAVRGAFEQFRGSPYFKKDPNYEYDKVLEAAFNDKTTIYSQSGELPETPSPDDPEFRRTQENQQAQQLRGMVIHDFIADVREYAESPDDNRVGNSIAFQMGVVFRFKGTAPEWLKENAEQGPIISQRRGADSREASTAEADFRQVRTFNIVRTDFSENPPQFQRVQQFTDANTIAITWDLVWESSLTEGLNNCQKEPEHHLMNYQVRRRALDGSDREVVYTVKSAQVLHREGSSVLKRLKPRFQVVDHFNRETLEDQAALPATGRSYLYTITPVDFAGNPGRPLTLVATRYPNEPPPVPVNGELIVRYRLKPEDLSAESATELDKLQLVEPDRLHVEWAEPVAVKAGPRVAIAQYQLVFRKDTTLPIGSYGLDSATQGPRTKSLPTTNARPLPTDIKIKLQPQGPQQARTAEISLRDLQDAGIFPKDKPYEWRTESWRVFFQTISANGVPSALAPVQLLLRVEAKPNDESKLATLTLLEEREERRPAELEWLPYPIKFPMLPPEDQRAISGMAHFPIPSPESLKFTGDLDLIKYQPHPAGIRCIRFRWNQGPSHQPEYPLDLHAGYQLLELDIDAHTNETFEDPVKLADALRNIQDIQMLPGEDLLLTPGDTLATNQWEAWYPSTILRRKKPEERAQGSEISLGPWYSWRESILQWPEWQELTDVEGDQRTQSLHGFLRKILDVLDEKFNLDLQISPPLQPGNFESFTKVTTAKADPYGWGILQRFGLTVAFSLRTTFAGVDPETGEVVAGEKTGKIITGQSVLDALKTALDVSLSDSTFQGQNLDKHLHVELLFQPGRSVSLESENASPDSLLATVQISLRPIVKQVLEYSKLEVIGLASASLDLVFNLKKDTFCSLINQAEPANGQIELKPEKDPVKTAIKQTIKLPLNGKTALLFQTKGTPIEIGIELKKEPKNLNVLQQFSSHIEYRNATHQIIIKASFNLNNLTQEQRQQIRKAINDDENDETTNLLFSPTRTQIILELPKAPLNANVLQTFSEHFEYRVIPHQIIIKPSFNFKSLNEAQREEIRQALGDQNQNIINTLSYLKALQSFPVTDELSTYFTVSTKTLAQEFSSISDEEARNNESKKQWLRFKRYAESINSNDADVSADLKIDIPKLIPDPEENSKNASFLPDFLGWSQRFFDAAGAVEIDAATKVGTASVGPWLVTAYPRVGSPAYATPDASGRLTYDHLLEDKWAHNYRYYIRPAGRYDLLWQSFLRSQVLFAKTEQATENLSSVIISEQSLVRLKSKVPEGVWNKLTSLKNQVFIGRKNFLKALEATVLDAQTAALAPVILEHTEKLLDIPPNPEAGGLDVVLDRTQPVDMPLVLSSSRLDAVSTPENPAPPGSIWEVVIAQHPEQSLIERNQTLARQLAFRQVAFTLLRRFTYPKWIPQLESAVKKIDRDHKIEVKFVENQLPGIPEAYPDKPDHIELGKNLSEDVALRLNLPERIGDFQQGALVLQWEALPFYYQHRLLLVAQTASNVSPINEVIQRDFEYHSPTPKAIVEGIHLEPEKLRARQIQVPLQRFWDCLPESAKQQWRSEEPDAIASQERQRKFSSLPDPEVVYQIVETFSGNIEVQAEFFFKLNETDSSQTTGKYVCRQLGRSFQADIIDLIPPPPNQPQGDYILKATLRQRIEEELKRTTYDREKIAEPTKQKVSFKGKKLMSFVGIFIREDRDNILISSVEDSKKEALRTLLQPPGFDENSLQTLFPDASERKDFFQDFQALDRIYQDWFSQEPVSRPIPLDSLPAGLKDVVDFPAPTEWTLVWEGTISAEERDALLALPGDEDFKRGLNRLATAAAKASEKTKVGENKFTVEVVSLPFTPPPIPANFNNQLIVNHQPSTGAVKLRWNGLMFDAQEVSLKQWAQNPDFATAANFVVNQLDGTVVEKTLPPPRPVPEELPEIIREKLQIDANKLTWLDVAIAQAERTALTSLTGDADFLDAIARLLAAIDTDQSVDMVEIPQRPRQKDLPESLKSQLTIQPTQLKWTGRLHSPEQLQALQNLTGDQPLTTAIQSASADLNSKQIEVDFTLPVRPQPEDLPAIVQDKLLIGKARIRYHGLMTVEEGLALRSLYNDSQPDQQAIQRLYGSSMNKGLRGRALQIRARRGSAAPNSNSFDPKQL